MGGGEKKIFSWRSTLGEAGGIIPCSKKRTKIKMIVLYLFFIGYKL